MGTSLAPWDVPHNPHQPPRYLAGLDLGKMTDPTALIIAQREMILGPARVMEPRFIARHLERVPLRTSYPMIVRGVRARLAALGEPCTLIVDATGVGVAVVDLFREAVSDEVLEQEAVLHPRFRLPRRLAPIAITITWGEKPHQVSWADWHVPRKVLIMACVVALQQGRLWTPDVPEAHVLIKEAQNFDFSVSKAVNDQYEAWRQSDHDDLLFAASILVWWGDKFAPKMDMDMMTGGQAKLPGNPLKRPALVGRGRW